MKNKYIRRKAKSICDVSLNTLAVLFTNDFHIVTGSTGEDTDIILKDYGKHLHSMTPGYVSDADIMEVMCDVRVIDEEYILPQRFDNYIYCRAERGEHTTDGFRKLRIIHSPGYYSTRQYRVGRLASIINMSVQHGYVSSSIMLQQTVRMQTGDGTQGPAHIVEYDGLPNDMVICFYVKSWPKEAESWFTRQTHWPDRKLKRKIRKTGYLLVPIGNRNSQESDLEWRCSFSVAEQILFLSLTTFQRLTFVMLKVLFKQYLQPDINTDGEKQLLSTYHIKTLFLWSLEDSQVKWEPVHMLRNIGHMFEKLLSWIKQQYLPHYFISSINLLDGIRLHGRQKSLICSISAITNDLSNKIQQSQFFMGQYNLALDSEGLGFLDDRSFFLYVHHYIRQCFTGWLQATIHNEVFYNNHIFRKLPVSHSMLIEGLISIKLTVDPEMQHFYNVVNSDPIHYKLLIEVVPGLIYQYLGCIHLAKYCIAARDNRVLPDVLHTAELLLKDTLHIDPCSGYVQLACLYIATRDFVRAMDRLHAAENNFLLIHTNLVASALRKPDGVDVDIVSTKAYTHEVFQKWAEGKVTSDIAVTLPEYITMPDLVQFELIHESTQHVIDVQYKHGDDPGKMISINCFLQWPPLSLIKLLKFVCAINSGQSSKSHMENLVADVIACSQSLLEFGMNIYTIFNMAAWCYVKIKKYKPAAHMITVAIESSSETEITKICAFSHHFAAHVIEQCLAKISMVNKRDKLDR